MKIFSGLNKENQNVLKKGFTLIEILLVMAIVLTVGFLSAAFPARLIFQMSVQDTESELKSVLRKAEAYAISGREHSSWGVRYGNSKLTLFKGDAYASRDQSFDENTDLSENISISGFTETVFIRPGGRPQENISNITISRNNESSAFSLNEEGVIK